MKGYRKIVFFGVILAIFGACTELNVSDDPSLRLTFSCDTLRFDTVFTAQGSSTAQIKVYNRNANALLIDRVWLNNGSCFRANVDGEADLRRLTALQINGGDSLYIFVRVEIDPTNQNNPVLVEDQLCFHLHSGVTQQLQMEAYGQDVERIGTPGCQITKKLTMTFTGDKPYLIYDTLRVNGKMTMKPGATIYMHSGACIVLYGNVDVHGTVEQPVVIRGDRLDRLFDSVPYRYAGGGWDGIYIVDKAETNNHSYVWEYADILSGTVGLMCVSDRTTNLSQLTLNGCRIHNHTQYGLYINNIDAKVSNSEISNCAYYCVYCDGGEHLFAHTTVASYFGNTNIRIQSADKEATSAVYISNLSKQAPVTVTSFYNSIITGYLTNQLVVATPFDQFYPGVFKGNYLKTDTLRMPNASDNVYWQKTDTAAVFRQDFYRYKEYIYYDFHLDSLSPAIGIGDSIYALDYKRDRENISRENVKPDAGCYQHPSKD